MKIIGFFIMCMKLQKNFEIFSVAQSSDFWKNRDYMSRLGGGRGGGMDKKTNFIEMFIVKMYFHFKTLSMRANYVCWNIELWCVEIG